MNKGDSDKVAAVLKHIETLMIVAAEMDTLAADRVKGVLKEALEVIQELSGRSAAVSNSRVHPSDRLTTIHSARADYGLAGSSKGKTMREFVNKRLQSRGHEPLSETEASRHLVVNSRPEAPRLGPMYVPIYG